MRNSRVENLPHALIPTGTHTSVAVEATAKTFAELGYTPPDCDYLEIYVENGSARVTADGATAPVATVIGMPWLTGNTFRIERKTAMRMKLIIEADAPVLQIQPMDV